MTDATSDTPPAPLGVIAGDRACAACGFNLVGQNIVREDHYGLAIVRCPECGTVASLQEYPALGRWATRWAGFLAVVWLIAWLGAFAGGTMATFGLTLASAELVSQPIGDALADQYDTWLMELPEDEASEIHGGPILGTRAVSRWDVPRSDAWSHTHALRLAGGIGGLIDWAVVWVWALTALIAAPFGVFWGLSMLHRARWRIAAVPLLGALIAGALAVTVVRTRAGATPTFQELGMVEALPFIVPTTVGVSALTMVALSLAARPIARRVVVVALPPRLRVPFGVLWTSAGMQPPRPR